MAKKTKFKKGDTITAIIQGSGVPEATILEVLKDKYYCKIPNGWLYLPFSGEDRYKLMKSK